MAKKYSMQRRVAISNGNHNRLRQKHNYTFCNDPSESVAEKALVKCWYHSDVVHAQTVCKRILTKEEKRSLYLSAQKQMKENKKRRYN